MKIKTIQKLLSMGFLSSLLFGGVSVSWAQQVPTDAQGGCPISPQDVAGFFESGVVTLNGVVKPADSTAHLQPNCDFFKWSEQMFLWLTSPAPASYGGGSIIMFSPQFFTVSPEGSDGRRTFLANHPGRPIIMNLRAMETGIHGLPVVMTRTGQIVEVQKEVAGAKPPLIRLAGGKSVPATQIASVKRDAKGNLNLLDVTGKTVPHQMLKLAPAVRKSILLTGKEKALPVVSTQALASALQARKFVIGHIPIFIDPAGNVIDVEVGQADSGVLISQNGSLVYYITTVNDVFAYFRTMQGPNLIPFNNTIKFPINAAQVAPIVAFASSKGHTIKEPTALAIETKSSWIEASKVPNPQDYVQVTAEVPTFDKSNPNQWVPNGKAALKLVMVGLHVVGSTGDAFAPTNGHPEMVWGTFEHLNNAPNATYAYNSTAPGPNPKIIAQNTVGNWIFTPNGSAGPFNQTSNTWTGAAITGNPVGPAAVLRAKPWGSNDGGNPANAAGMNTQVISANSSVISQLKPGDVRAKYFQLGTTWTIGGQPPNPGNQVGTNHLANGTMETFAQGQTPSDASSNCFDCHTTNTVSVSHVFREAKPLQ